MSFVIAGIIELVTLGIIYLMSGSPRMFPLRDRLKVLAIGSAIALPIAATHWIGW